MPHKILVVDDEPDLEILITQRFRKRIREQDLDFVFAGNGQEALAKLESNGGMDVVLTDINMPVMDGLKFIERIRANPVWEKLPIIVITTEGSEGVTKESIKKGANNIVKKPFTPEQIKEKLSPYFA